MVMEVVVLAALAVVALPRGGGDDPEPAADTLARVFKQLRENGALDNCPAACTTVRLRKAFSDDERNRIALAFGVIDTNTRDPGVVVKPKRGRSVDVGGIGIAGWENEKYLGIEKDAWYWEVEACATNRRVLINAISGEPSPVHAWVTCGGVE